MKDVITSINSPDGLFHDGDQSTGALGTIVTAKFQNDVQAGLQNVQAELIKLIKTANPAAVLDPEKTDQVLTALYALFLRSGNNLSEIAAAGAAYQLASRQNLGLKGAAILDVGSVAGTVAAGNDSRITGAAQKANNLSDLNNAATARANLGLSNVALKTDVYLSNNNLSELASAGAASQTAARLNLGNVPAKNEVYLSNNNLSEISAAGSAPQAAARSNLGLGTTATRNIGTGSNQVPDMGAFPAGLGSAGAFGATGYQRLPGRYIRQWGTAVADSNGDVSITFPIAFSVKPDAVYFGCRQLGVPTAIQSIIINDPLSDNTRVVCRAYKIDGSLTITGSTSAFYWVAEGKV